MARRRSRLFRQARRHTILVRLLRVMFPLLMLAGFGYYGLLLKLKLGLDSSAIHFGKIEVTTEDLKMKNPSYFGVTSDHGKYEVHAREAAVDLAMTGPIKLEGITGTLIQASGVKTTIDATRGSLDNKNGLLDLLDGVEIVASNGMTAHLKNANVKTREHYVSTRDPMTADMPAGRLTASAMELWTDKKRAHFETNVTLKLVQQAGAAAPSFGIGSRGDNRQPIDIRSQILDIDDVQSISDFRGNVVASQGETELTAPNLHVVYEGRAVADQAGGQAPQPGSAASPQEPGGAQLARIEAFTGVVIIAGPGRRLIADRVNFDVKADTALFNGAVEFRQAQNVFRGTRLAVDRKVGRSRLDAPALDGKGPAGRIAATLVQAAEAGKGATPTKVSAKPRPGDPAGAQGPGAIAGLRSDPTAPTDIEADVLDVDDGQKTATFRGKVIAKQGDYVIETTEMVAHYSGQTGLMTSDGDGAAAKSVKAPKAAADAQGAQLTHLITRNGTRITTKDGKEALGANAQFDMKSNQILMEGPGGITLKQGPNISQGAKLRFDVATGEAHIENDPTQSNVHAPTPAELSKAAKPGVAPPTQPTSCQGSAGQQCMIIFPSQLEKSVAGDKHAKPADQQTSPQPAPQVAQPQWSPSTVYRSP